MLTIDYFSDVLCVWAYGGQVRLDELQRTFGEAVHVRHRFIPLFADTATRIGEGWREQGGFEGFGAHLKEVCVQWEHARLAPGAWTACRPVSSVTAHVFLKAAGLCLGIDGKDHVGGGDAQARFDRLVADVRRAFFEHAADIARLAVLFDLLEPVRLSPDAVRDRIDNGEAYAALHRDEQLMKAHGVQGSPTYVFNEGRQVLYGNVGYRIIESNVRELLSRNELDGAPSWC